MRPRCFTAQLLLVMIVLTFVQQTRRAFASLEKLSKFQRQCFNDIIPCIMFMDEERAYGCAQCEDDIRTELVREFSSAPDLKQFLNPENENRILMMPEYVFFSPGVLSELKVAENVAAVIVYPETTDTNDGSLKYPPIFGNALSTDDQEPNKKYNYYPTPTASPEVGPSPNPFARNDIGKSEKFFFFPFNIFRVSKGVAHFIRERVKKFPSKNDVGSVLEDSPNPSATSPRYKVQSVGQMYACPSVPVPTPNADVDGANSDSEVLGLLTKSETCLRDDTCLPIGGQSLWSALERVDPNEQLEYLAITAPMDSLAFFPELSLGASAEIASLAVLLAVAQAVSKYRRGAGSGKSFVRQPVYFALNAQSWGYTGSSRFLKDVNEFKCTTENNASAFVKGCKTPFMDSLKFQDFKNAKFTVLNIGQLTSPDVDEKKPTFDFYKQGGNEENDDASELENALDAAFKTVSMKRNNGLNLQNGLREVTPIDASQSFRRYKPGSDVLTVSNYGKKFTNTLYHTMYDNVTLIKERQPLYAAADAIANAVISLAFGDKDTQEEVDRDVLNGVLTCMVGRRQWADCELAKEYLGSLYGYVNASVIPGNYPGSFFPPTRLADTNESGAAKLAFIRSFLAYHNRYDEAEGDGGKCSARKEDKQDCTEFIKSINEAVQATTHSQLRTAFCTRSRCVASDTYTHNAYGAALKSNNDDQSKFVYNNDSTSAGQSDTPLEAGWTESVWDRDLGLCGFVEDTALFGGLILGAGVAVLLSSIGLAIWFDRAMFNAKPRETGGITIAAANPMWVPEAQPSA